MAKQNDFIHLDTLFPDHNLFLFVIRFNYTESPFCFSAVRQISHSLRDISPALLNLLKLNLPKEMTGGDLRIPLAK